MAASAAEGFGIGTALGSGPVEKVAALELDRYQNMTRRHWIGWGRAETKSPARAGPDGSLQDAKQVFEFLFVFCLRLINLQPAAVDRMELADF